MLLGLATGSSVRRLERARGWDLVPFFRGAVVGAFLSIPLLILLFDMDLPPGRPTYHDRLARLAVLAAGFLAGGFVGAART
ncbi:hypothetical protein [Paludisphaera mucosa]|uniref:Uncharacterized protein n=1 Tax=Paludisphaera mucosa TaxID=3030827 RepID=A0ABT6FB94_9BACT|nr:hypothetical protein [Paludisphaera mucosa]MDG3004860.1 hypothetical protein [Paludisphaera mucosa]